MSSLKKSFYPQDRFVAYSGQTLADRRKNKSLKKSGFNSKPIHSGGVVDALDSVVTPIYQTSTFRFKNATMVHVVSPEKRKGTLTYVAD